ncbi:MAG: hypothetical protein AAGE37_01555 [Pseudomonadota bacterium]
MIATLCSHFLMRMTRKSLTRLRFVPDVPGKRFPLGSEDDLARNGLAFLFAVCLFAALFAVCLFAARSIA